MMDEDLSFWMYQTDREEYARHMWWHFYEYAIAELGPEPLPEAADPEPDDLRAPIVRSLRPSSLCKCLFNASSAVSPSFLIGLLSLDLLLSLSSS